MDRSPLGQLAVVLHFHSPYLLSHGRRPHGAVQLAEAAADCYIPIIDTLRKLARDGVSPKTTIAVTPVLAEQFASHGFEWELYEYLQERVYIAERDEDHFAGLRKLHISGLAHSRRMKYMGLYGRFRADYGASVTRALAELQRDGHIELATSAATHAYLPLLANDDSVRLQVRQAVDSHKRHFGSEPRGFWMPEGGYRPAGEWEPPFGSGSIPRKGIDDILAENGLSYFLSDMHLLTGAFDYNDFGMPHPASEKLWARSRERADASDQAEFPNQVYECSSSGVGVLVRDYWACSAVWGPKWTGYAGDEAYLDYHRRHHPGGYRYWRVTGPEIDPADKEVYNPEKAAAKVGEHSREFVGYLRDVMRRHQETEGRPGMVCLTFDAQLFGSWWSEGIDWLHQVIKLVAEDEDIELVTGSEAVDSAQQRSKVTPYEGSWGKGYFHWPWFNAETEWVWRLIYDSESDMQEVLRRCGETTEGRRVMRQAAREMMLLQSSDWPFGISSKTAHEYGGHRVKEHYEHFKRLSSIARLVDNHGLSDSERDYLGYLEERDRVFPDISL